MYNEANMNNLILLINERGTDYLVTLEDNKGTLLTVGEFPERLYRDNIQKLYDDTLALAVKFISDRKMTRVSKIRHQFATKIRYEKEL